MKVGEIKEISYSGTATSFKVLTHGIYKIECWGAQGGTYSSDYIGGKGGYSSGIVTLKKGVQLHCLVGGKGSGGNSPIEGVYNGGGGTSVGGSSGGGATDIRLNETSLYSRILVAGGGGGGCYYGGEGGYGGGLIGGDGHISLNRSGTGGTQTEGGKTYDDLVAHYGSFGIGGSLTTGYRAGAGGGGWYGGGGAYDNDSDNDGRGGGGGSSYALSETSYKPNGYTPTSDYYFSDISIIDGNSTMPSPTTIGATQIGNVGNGFIRITLVESLSSVNAKCKINGSIKNVSDMKIKVNGAWKNVIGTKSKINGVWK